MENAPEKVREGWRKLVADTQQIVQALESLEWASRETINRLNAFRKDASNRTEAEKDLIIGWTFETSAKKLGDIHNGKTKIVDTIRSQLLERVWLLIEA